MTSLKNTAAAGIHSSKQLLTIVTHLKMRRAGELSFNPDGNVYLTDSDIPDAMLKSKPHRREPVLYYLFKFKALSKAKSGQ